MPHFQLRFQKSIGGSSDDFGSEISFTNDNGYIIVGNVASFGAGSDDIYLIKLNHNGDTIWTKSFGGSDEEYGSAVKQTSDGGYIIAGYSKSFGAADKDAYLTKTDSSGNIVWSRLFGTTGNDYGKSVLQTTDSVRGRGRLHRAPTFASFVFINF